MKVYQLDDFALVKEQIERRLGRTLTDAERAFAWCQWHTLRTTRAYERSPQPKEIRCPRG